MFSKKTNILTFIFIFIFSISQGSLFADSYKEITNGVVNSVCQYKDTSGVWAYNQPNQHHIGRHNGSNGINGNSNSDIYRSVYFFDLSYFADDVTITSVSLTVNTGYYQNSHQMEIRKYSDDPISHTDSEIWSNVNSGIIYHDNVEYGLTEFPANNNLKNSVQNGLSDDKMFIGILGKSENTDLSYCDDIELTLKINYIDKVDITVINSFGGGSFKIDDVDHNHNYVFRCDEESAHSFTNWDQTHSEKDYIFLDKWTNISTGQIYNGNPASISFTANCTLRAEFEEKVHITVKNRHNGGQLKVDSDTCNSGAEFDFVKNSEHDFESWEQFYSGFNMKFKDGDKWDMTERDYTTALVENHQVSSAGFYEAQLWQEYTYTADNSFMNGGSGGSLIINDETKTIPASNPYSDNTLEGDPFTMEAPQQSQTVNGRDVTYNFLKWENGTTNNPRSLSPDDHFDITANYKGHLVSSESRATGTNNGRRVYKTDDGDIYLVYEDNSDIYVTHSTNDGNTWSKETRIDVDSRESKYPSVTGLGNILYVTWTDKTNKDIVLRRLNLATNSWYNINNVISFNYYNSIKPHPAIAVSPNFDGIANRVHIIFQREKMGDDFTPSGESEIVCYKSSDSDYAIWQTILGPLNGDNPSISYQRTGGLEEVGMVWDNDGKIYFKKINQWDEWSSTKQISEDVPWRIGESKPNISYTFGIAHIVWQGEDGVEELLNGYYRNYEPSTNTFSTISQFAPTKGGEDVSNLSVSSVDASNVEDSYKYDIVYESEDKIIKISKSDNSTSSEVIGAGYYPNITEHDMDRAVWTKYTSSPYFIENDYVESGGGQLIKPIRPVSPRLDYILAAAQNNNVEGCITLEVENVTFNADTLYLKDDLMTDSLSITQNYIPMEVEFKVRFHDVYNTPDPEKVLFNFVLNENQQEHLLTQVKHKELPSPNGINFEHTFKRTTLVNLMGKTGRIQFKSDSSEFILTNVYKLETESYGLAKNSAKNQIIPEKFILSQNFPNPFNPSTHITVELPKSGQVNLSVYNLNGQKVKELIAGNHEAGIYEVVFDGAGLASGIYFYRLQAGNFIQTKRMLLLK